VRRRAATSPGWNSVATRWLEGLEEETARVYGAVMRRMAESVGDPFLAEESELAKFVRRSSGSLAMRRRCVSAIHSFYRFALDEDAITRDPSRNVYLRRIDRRSNADLLKSVGSKNGEETLSELIADAVEIHRFRWTSEAGREMLRRMAGLLRRCSDDKELLRLLRAKFSAHK